MTKEKIYTYLGTNGTVTTPIELPGVQAMIQYRLTASAGKILSNGEQKTEIAIVLEKDLANWKEIKK